MRLPFSLVSLPGVVLLDTGVFEVSVWLRCLSISLLLDPPIAPLIFYSFVCLSHYTPYLGGEGPRLSEFVLLGPRFYILLSKDALR